MELKLRPHLGEVYRIEEGDKDDGVGVAHGDGGYLGAGGREGER